MQNTIDEWNTIFRINAVFYVAPAVFFIIFGSGKVQKWNDANKKQNTADVENDDNSDAHHVLPQRITSKRSI